MLLKKSRCGVDVSFVKNVISKYEKQMKDCTLSPKTIDEKNPSHPKFIGADVNEFDVIDPDSRTPYNISLEMDFNSIFSNVRDFLSDEYQLDPYDPSRSQMVIDEKMAKDMLVAANYILLEHFDEKIEKVMDNPFIEPIGSMSDRYSEYKYRLKFPDDTEPFDEEDNTYTIERLRTILEAYLSTETSDDYILVVELWG